MGLLRNNPTPSQLPIMGRERRQGTHEPRSARKLKADWIEDAGSRDLSYKRPGFQKLLKDVEGKKLDWIVVAERDRFGVADNEEWGYFVTILRRHNCQLWAVSDDKELTNRDRPANSRQTGSRTLAAAISATNGPASRSS